MDRSRRSRGKNTRTEGWRGSALLVTLLKRPGPASGRGHSPIHYDRRRREQSRPQRQMSDDFSVARRDLVARDRRVRRPGNTKP